jgi:hypothetical protein
VQFTCQPSGTPRRPAPLYNALLLVTPLLLALARRDDRLMLAASAGFYLAARAFSLNFPTWPVEGTWFFNPIAWQLIFAIGILAGRRIKRGGIAYDARPNSAMNARRFTARCLPCFRQKIAHFGTAGAAARGGTISLRSGRR